MPDSEQQPDEITPFPENLAKEVINKQVHQFMLGLQVGHQPAPGVALVDKFQPEHITATIASAENESRREHISNRLFFIGGVVGALLLCLMFLGFSQAALVEKSLIAFLGFAGGYGIGRTSARK